MNREIFFTYVRRAPFGGRLSNAQVDGLGRVLDEWERRGLTDDRWLAYMLATTFHETAGKMQPIREMGGEAYLKKKPYYPWVGEGLVQVTWETNHRKFGATKPGQLLTWPIALRGLFDGMTNGVFTGKNLSDYFSATIDDPVNARRIVNGTDKAKLVAGYHKNFLDALKAAREGNPADYAPELARPDDVPASNANLTLVSGAGIGATVLGAISNPYALWAFALVLVVAVIWAWRAGLITINRKAVA